MLFGWVNITNFQRFGFDHLSNANGAELVGFFLIFIIQLNVILGIFNLIPIHPLDGFKVLLGILPNKLSGPLSRLSKWGPAILMLFIAITFIKPEYSPIRWILDDLAGYFLNLLLP